MSNLALKVNKELKINQNTISKISRAESKSKCNITTNI